MNVKDRYIYPAIFDFDNDGITVTFPDLLVGIVRKKRLEMLKKY